LYDVRALIVEEFDDDMLPFEDFCFHVNGIRISEKQERKKQAWNISTISLHSKSKHGTKRKLEPPSSSCSLQNAGKRGRSENENHDETPPPASTLACASTESPAVESSSASNTGPTTQSNDSNASASASASAITRSTPSTPAAGASGVSVASNVASVAASSIVAKDASEMRARVLKLLEKRNKGKVDRIDDIMERFKGKESLLLELMKFSIRCRCLTTRPKRDLHVATVCLKNCQR
jgi:hypothetical protein